MPRPHEFAPSRLYQPACRIIDRLRQAGHQAYIAGGAVRDHLLGRTQSDLDIATSATPPQVRALFRRTVAVGESFGVVIVQEDTLAFEVATFREDLDYEDGRHPHEVRYSTAEEDVRRRDFTINGMLWDPQTEEILDWVGGRLDIQARQIRAIGVADERFQEDRLRMLRAIRFAAQLDFTIEASTWQAIRERAKDLAPVSTERIRDELGKLLAAPGWREGLRLLQASGMEPVIRERLLHDWQNQHRGRTCPIPLDGTLGAAAFSSMPADPAIPWLLLLLPAILGMPPHATALTPLGNALDSASVSQRDALPGWLRELGMALRLSQREARDLEDCCQVLLALPAIREARLSSQLRLLRHPGMSRARLLLPIVWPSGLADLETWLQNQLHSHDSMLHPVPFLDGNDLMALGVPRGPLLGMYLEELENLQLEQRLASIEDARQMVAHWLSTGSVAGGMPGPCHL